MGELVNIEPSKNSVIDILEGALEDARKGEISAVFMSMLRTDDEMTYSRAGNMKTGENCLAMIGSLECHKASIIYRMHQNNGMLD